MNVNALTTDDKTTIWEIIDILTKRKISYNQAENILDCTKEALKTIPVHFEKVNQKIDN